MLKSFCHPSEEQGVLYIRRDTMNTNQGGWMEWTNRKHKTDGSTRTSPLRSAWLSEPSSGVSTVERSAIFTKPILWWFVTLSALSGFCLGTLRGILKKTFQIRQWHLGYDSSHLTLAVHKMQGWDWDACLDTRYLTLYGMFCLTQDLYRGLADVTQHTGHLHILRQQPASLLSPLLRQPNVTQEVYIWTNGHHGYKRSNHRD